jgi:hypothetical protein
VFAENTLSGNIIDEPIAFPGPSACELMLDFSCGDNSQYLPLI